MFHQRTFAKLISTRQQCANLDYLILFYHRQQQVRCCHRASTTSSFWKVELELFLLDAFAFLSSGNVTGGKHRLRFRNFPISPSRSLSHQNLSLYLNPCLFAIPLLIISSWGASGGGLFYFWGALTIAAPQSVGAQSVPGERVARSSVIYMGIVI